MTFANSSNKSYYNALLLIIVDTNKYINYMDILEGQNYLGNTDPYNIDLGFKKYFVGIKWKEYFKFSECNHGAVQGHSDFPMTCNI